MALHIHPAKIVDTEEKENRINNLTQALSLAHIDDLVSKTRPEGGKTAPTAFH